jgi:Protein of unknown function (DUF3365)
MRSLLLLAALVAACKQSEASDAPRSADLVSARQAADMIHAAIAADRAAYAREVVQRLTVTQKVQIIDPEKGAPAPLAAREDWRSQHGALPLPAQMLRMGAEQVLAGDSGLSYLLLSPWPVNKQNRARTELETRGLAEVTRTGKPLYGSELLGGQTYYAAFYPDVAVADACVACHNAHPDSPRRDFKTGDVMGAVVIRFPLR